MYLPTAYYVRLWSFIPGIPLESSSHVDNKQSIHQDDVYSLILKTIFNIPQYTVMLSTLTLSGNHVSNIGADFMHLSDLCALVMNKK